VGTLFSGCLVFAGTLFGYSVASQWGPDAVWILPRRYLVICLPGTRPDAVWILPRRYLVICLTEIECKLAGVLSESFLETIWGNL
jgi:hypothetical protein